MKNISFTITAANLDSGEQAVDLPLTIRNEVYYPLEFQITNSTGTDLEYCFFTEDEYTEYTGGITAYYAFIPFPDSTTIYDEESKFGKHKKFVVRKTIGTVLFDLTGTFVNYVVR